MSEKIIKTICRYASDHGHAHLNLEAKKDNLLCTCGHGSEANYLQLDSETELNIKAAFRKLVGANEHDLFNNQRFKIADDKEIIKGRVSLLPANTGEKLLISLSTEHPKIFRFSGLGLNKKQQTIFRQALNRKSGIIILSASEENGASSSYYSLLKTAATKRSAYSIEDFPLHNIDNINTINSNGQQKVEQIIDKLMTLDSEVIAIDAHLDTDDLKTIWRAANSGRLLIITLPTINAAAALKLLRKAGLSSLEIAQQTIFISAQKLFKRPCSRCSEVFDPGSEIKKTILKAWPIAKQYWPKKFYRQRDCPYCQKNNNKQKTAIFEIMSFLADGRLRKGYQPLIKEALDKTATGLINIEDIATWAQTDTKL
jgi:type II secretory ATPase GspE/PulE/Tfp pilus assembly ATPase PilB-like protein